MRGGVGCFLGGDGELGVGERVEGGWVPGALFGCARRWKGQGNWTQRGKVEAKVQSENLENEWIWRPPPGQKQMEPLQLFQTFV